MAIDLRGHTVPAAGDNPSRGALLALGLSVNDPIPVANTTARATKVSDLAAAGVTPTAAVPLFFWRADADGGAELEVTTNGTTFKPVASWATIANRSMAARRSSDGTFASGSMASITSGSLPAGAPAGLYSVTWTWVLSCTATATANLRGQFAGAVVTNDDAVDVLTTRQSFTIPTLVTHTGGAATLTQFVQVSTGTGNARAGCRIAAVWMGPA